MAEQLVDKKCVPCEGGTPPLKGEDIQNNKSQLKNDWKVVDDTKIRHEFKFKDFKGAMAFVNRVADVAEEEGHHPDIHIHYNKVLIELWTHAIGGLSENDFIMAAKVERLG
jgi:Pterin-4a-carbinolamine dehydratase